MAQTKPVQRIEDVLSALERVWIQKALQTQRAALIRARGKEIVGSDIHNLRGKEIEQLSELLNRFGGQ